MTPVFISEYAQSRFLDAVLSGAPIRQAGAQVGLSRSTADRLWQRLRPTPERRWEQVWTPEQSEQLCQIIAAGGSYADAAAALPFTRRQCQDRVKTLQRRKRVRS